MRAQLRPTRNWRAPSRSPHVSCYVVYTCFGNAQPRAPETGVPLVAFTLKPEKLEHGYTEFDIADRLRQAGWVVPVRMVHIYICAPKSSGCFSHMQTKAKQHAYKQLC